MLAPPQLLGVLLLQVYNVTEFLDEHPGGFDIILTNTGGPPHLSQLQQHSDGAEIPSPVCWLEFLGPSDVERSKPPLDR